MMTMGFPPFQLTDPEVARTERLDSEVARILLEEGINARFLWSAPGNQNERTISLRIAGREHAPIAEFSATDFATATDDVILRRVFAGARAVRMGTPR